MTEIWNLSALCRCCHLDGEFKSLQTQYTHRKEIEVYSVLLRDTFGILIHPPTFEASYSICEECIVRLRDANRFKNQVLQCEQKFQEYCQNEQFHSESNEDIKKEVDNDSEYSDTLCDKDTATDFDEKSDIAIEKCKNNFEVEVDISTTENNIKDEDNPVTIKAETKSDKLKQSKVAPKKVIQKENTLTTKVKKHQKRNYNLAMLIQTETGQKITCAKCGEIFQNENSINEHIRQTHKKYQCTECHEIYKNQKDYYEHSQSLHRNQYICCFCKKYYPRLNTLEGHLNTHTRSKKYICDYCNKSFFSRSIILKHINWHAGKNKKVVCETCGKSFNDATNLRKHVDGVHKKIKNFQCDVCMKKLSSKKSLKLHANIHKGIKNFVCTKCPASYACYKSYSAHMKQCLGPDENILPEKRNTAQMKQCLGPDLNILPEERNYICKFCKSSFIGRGNLIKHMKIHQGTLPFVCPICKKDFACRYSMKRHIKEHSGLKKFECDICQKKFTQKQIVVRHKRNVHEKVNQEKIKCDICKIMVFDMKKHLRSHTDRPYSCQYCEKNYAAKNTLNRHISISHLGVRKFKCDICREVYAKINSLVRHKLKKHNVVHKAEVNYDEVLQAHTVEIEKKF